MKTHLTKFIVCILILTFSLSCKKGDTGPQGAKGDTGQQGPKGDAGPQGNDGNANIISSGWITVSKDKWAKSGGAGAKIYSEPGDISIPWGTNGFYNLNATRDDPGHSAILVYVDDGKGAKPLPVTKSIIGGSKSGVAELRYLFDTNLQYALWLDLVIALKSGQWDDNYIQNTYLPSLKWRVVVIPQPVVSAHKNLNLADYQSVKKAFNLSE